MTSVRSQSGDAADRVYSLARKMDWAVTADWTVNSTAATPVLTVVNRARDHGQQCRDDQPDRPRTGQWRRSAAAVRHHHRDRMEDHLRCALAVALLALCLLASCSTASFGACMSPPRPRFDLLRRSSCPMSPGSPSELLAATHVALITLTGVAASAWRAGRRRPRAPPTAARAAAGPPHQGHDSTRQPRGRRPGARYRSAASRG